MNNIFENEKIVKAFKEISLAKFEVYVNNYMKENFTIGDKYDYKNVHSIIKENMLKGFRELLSDYEIDYAMIYETFYFGVWRFTLKFNIDLICVWEDIGQYFFETRKRKNASCNNSSFTLLSLPNFQFYEEDKNISLYDLVVKTIEKKRQDVINVYERQIEDYKRNIADNGDMIQKLKNIKVGW